MPAKLIDLDLSRPLPDACDVLPYTQAFIVARFRGVPVGHCWIAAPGGHIPGAVLEREVVRAAMPALSRRWFERRLGIRSAPPRFAPRDVTVVVCTRDRPLDVRRCLGAIERLDPAPASVLVVDNAPAGPDTAEVVAARPGARYVREPRAGLNVARNRALREAQTPVVAFCDDDATPETAWLEGLLSGFDHPLVLVTTGLTLPAELDTPAQEWFERTSPFGRGYFRRVFDPMQASAHGTGQAGAGANMAVRRDVLQLVGGFDERLDAGTPARSGGDHDLFSRVMQRGYRIVYEPAAVSRHRHRREWADLRATLRGYGTGVYASWTGQLARGQIAVIKQAAAWLVGQQLPLLASALARRPSAPPVQLVLDELLGCATGPFAWFASARRHAAPGRAA